MLRCRPGRVELLLGVHNALATVPAKELRLAYRVNGAAAVEQQWTVSSNNDALSVRGDVAILLREWPDAARIAFQVFRRDSPWGQSVFAIGEFSVVRQKIVTVCRLAGQ
jgi:hypothetical protein